MCSLESNYGEPFPARTHRLSRSLSLFRRQSVSQSPSGLCRGEHPGSLSLTEQRFKYSGGATETVFCHYTTACFVGTRCLGRCCSLVTVFKWSALYPGHRCHSSGGFGVGKNPSNGRAVRGAVVPTAAVSVVSLLRREEQSEILPPGERLSFTSQETPLCRSDW